MSPAETPPEPRITLVLTTFDQEEKAAAAAQQLVLERWAACGTCIPGARSFYVWQGKLEETREVVLLLKTTADRAPGLAQRLRALHPYSVPEIVAGDAMALNGAYAAWVRDAVGPEAAGGAGDP